MIICNHQTDQTQTPQPIISYSQLYFYTVRVVETRSGAKIEKFFEGPV